MWRSHVYYRIVAAQIMLGILTLGAPFEGYGQTESSCGRAIAEAQSQYQSGNFNESIQLLYECLIRKDVRDENVVQAYRLLTLSYLQEENLNKAKLTIVRLLEEVPDYTPDAVQDPPSYVALVKSVKKQLEVEGESALEQQAYDQSGLNRTRWTQDLLFEGGAGFTHYGGERGQPAENALQELGSGAGAALKIKATYMFASRFGAGMYYSAGRFPELHTEKGGSQFEPIDEATSSTWIHELGLFGTVRLFQQAPISPFAQVGVTSAYTLKNDVFRAGFGPKVGIGVEIPFSRKVGMFMEGTGSFIFPGDTLDLVDESGSYDTISSLTVGLQYRINEI